MPSEHSARIRSLSIAALIVLLMCWVSFSQTPVSAQNAIVSSTSTTISAGSSTTVTVTVTNQTGRTATFTISAAPPSGWTAQLGNTSLTLNNGTSQAITVNITVPSGITAGNYIVTVNAFGAATATGFITVTVPSAVTGITIAPLFTSITGAAGQSGIAANITLTSTSSVDRRFVLSAVNIPTGITIRLPVNNITVRTGSSFPFPIFVDLGTDAPRGQNIAVGIIRFTEQSSQSIVADTYLTFSVTGGLGSCKALLPAVLSTGQFR